MKKKITVYIVVDTILPNRVKHARVDVAKSRPGVLVRNVLSEPKTTHVPERCDENSLL